MKIFVFVFIAVLLQTCGGKENAKTLRLEDYDAPKTEVCRVHNLKLQKDVVPLTYGSIIFEPDYTEAAKTLFPHAADNFHNAHNAKNYERAEVLFCAECRRAKQIWLQNRKTPAP